MVTVETTNSGHGFVSMIPKLTAYKTMVLNLIWDIISKNITFVNVMSQYRVVTGTKVLVT